ncbi:MAG TPA: TetR/AcrR family transcriptional regulator [Solirubrobacterales bacterium]|nr:TetR/AcrR family transcriptional regulator [Solirubrobacterales bacterium]
MSDLEEIAVLPGAVTDESSQLPGSRGTVGMRPGRETLSREFVAHHQRTRMIHALAEEVVENGYRDVTVAGIVKRAGVARNTFYETFGNKEECFLAASDLAGEEAMRRVADVLKTTPPDWPSRIRAGIGAFLAFAASESALARVFVVESLSAGPAAAERYERTVRAVVPFFRLGRRSSDNGDNLPPTLEETIIGGIFWIVYQRIVVGRPEELEGLLEELAEFALTPYIGVKAARKAAYPAHA